VLVATSSAAIARPVERWGGAEGRLTLPARSRDHALATTRAQRPEVLLVDLMFRGSEGVALAIDLLKQAPGAEVVFVVEALDDPEVRAARAVGISRFVRTPDLDRYLETAVPALAELARARRMLERAERAVQSLPSWSEQGETSAVPLAVAERRYRESYLRATLARGGGRREAARLTGVPYTTLCVMLRKLGITPAQRDS
jgi:DNA-binding NtrC family response regulator